MQERKLAKTFLTLLLWQRFSESCQPWLCVSSALAILHAVLNDRSRHVQLNKTVRNGRKPKTVTPFPKSNIDTIIQSQVLTASVNKSILHFTMHE